LSNKQQQINIDPIVLLRQGQSGSYRKSLNIHTVFFKYFCSILIYYYTALCRKRDICYSEKTSALDFFFTYLEIKIIHEIYITWKMMIWSFSIIFFKNFFSYFIENFEAENNFWSQHCRRLQLIYLLFYSLDYYLSRKIGHRHCCVRKI